VTWRYAVWKQDASLAAEATIVTVGMDMDTYAKRELPSWLREKLAAYGASVAAPAPA
jgi:acyl-CoA thioesterase FadM